MATQIRIRVSAEDLAGPTFAKVKAQAEAMGAGLKVTVKSSEEVARGFQKVSDAGQKTESAFQRLTNQARLLQGALVVGLAAGLTQLAVAAAKAEQTAEAFGRVWGDASDEVLAALKRVSAGTVSEANLMLAANRAMALGVAKSADELATLFEIARDRARLMGLSVTQAFNDLVTGLGRGSALILDNLGLVVKVGTANEQYAAQLGKTVAALTDAEKKQALINAVLAQAGETVDQAALATRTAAEEWEAFSVAVEEARLAIGQALLPTLEAILPILTQIAAISDKTSLALEHMIDVALLGAKSLPILGNTLSGIEAASEGTSKGWQELTFDIVGSVPIIGNAVTATRGLVDISRELASSGGEAATGVEEAAQGIVTIPAVAEQATAALDELDTALRGLGQAKPREQLILESMLANLEARIARAKVEGVSPIVIEGLEGMAANLKGQIAVITTEIDAGAAQIAAADFRAPTMDELRGQIAGLAEEMPVLSRVAGATEEINEKLAGAARAPGARFGGGPFAAAAQDLDGLRDEMEALNATPLELTVTDNAPEVLQRLEEIAAFRFPPKTVLITLETSNIPAGAVGSPGRRQHGGPVGRGEMAIVGEAGPELVVGPGQVIPLRGAQGGAGGGDIFQLLDSQVSATEEVEGTAREGFEDLEAAILGLGNTLKLFGMGGRAAREGIQLNRAIAVSTFAGLHGLTFAEAVAILGVGNVLAPGFGAGFGEFPALQPGGGFLHPPSLQEGGTVRQNTLALLHAGETVLPAGRAGALVQNITVNYQLQHMPDEITAQREARRIAKLVRMSGGG